MLYASCYQRPTARGVERCVRDKEVTIRYQYLAGPRSRNGAQTLARTGPEIEEKSGTVEEPVVFDSATPSDHASAALQTV